jgi:all-trans-8'-apo-beta-carotenal 15,15'-oxygenase
MSNAIIPPRAGRIFDSLHDEHDYVVRETEGTLPEGLRGTLYRNGPGRLEIGGSPLGHMFDGDGMISAFTVADGLVRYRNRYVRTPHYLKNQATSAPSLRGLGTLKPGGPLANAFRLPANVANTSVVLHAGDLLALWEGGRPFALDPTTLETRGVQDFEGGLKWLGAFSAHPKRDPLTGDLYNFGIDVLPRPRISCYRVDTAGHLHRIRTVPLPEPVFCHDFALTRSSMVFVIDPLGISLATLPKVMLGMTTFDQAFRFHQRRGTTIAIVPRDGSTPRIIQTDALLHFHANNAFDDGTDVVVDLVRWDRDWESFNQSLRAYDPADPARPDDWEFGGYLMRMRITPDGRVIREDLSPTPGEFPQLDQRLNGVDHQFTYLAGRVGPSEEANAIVVVDHHAGTQEHFVLPDGHAVSEPVFAPRGPRADEGDGWLLAVAYDPVLHRSRLLVFDTRQVHAGPVFTAHLRHHVPQSFHGIFTDQV